MEITRFFSSLFEYLTVKRNLLVRNVSLIIPKHLLQKNVRRISPVVLQKDSDSVIAVFSGTKDLYEAFVCLHSFYHYSEEKYTLYWFDDGTLTTTEILAIEKRFINCRVISERAAREDVVRWLESYAFSGLLKLRSSLVFGRRLTNMFYYLAGKNVLQLDSDVMFLNTPTELLKAMSADSGHKDWLYNVDARTSYCTSLDKVREITGVDVMEGFNAGLVSYRPSRSDFKRLEELSMVLPVDELFFWEQTLFAVLAAEKGAMPLSSDYEVHFRHTGNQKDKVFEVACRHYCSDSRRYFYKHFNERQFSIINV